MSHLTEKIPEFILEELPGPEMVDARRHLAQCTECRQQVDRFQRTLAILKAQADFDPPRNIVFEFEKPARRRLWKWLPATVAAAALLLVTIALSGTVHLQWRDSRLTIAFGQTTGPAQPDRTAELALELERMRGRLDYLEVRQQEVENTTFVIATKIQPMPATHRSPAGD